MSTVPCRVMLFHFFCSALTIALALALALSIALLSTTQQLALLKIQTKTIFVHHHHHYTTAPIIIIIVIIHNSFQRQIRLPVPRTPTRNQNHQPTQPLSPPIPHQPPLHTLLPLLLRRHVGFLRIHPPRTLRMLFRNM